MNIETLRKTAQTMVEDGRGILAMDESTGTCTKRFEAHGVESTEENRRKYRQTLVTTPELGKHISGAILFDETIRQKTDDGTPFVKVLQDNNVMPGIKVDMKAKDHALFPGEKITHGLDGLRDRLKEYKEMGAKFAKWRAVITIRDNLPTDGNMKANAHALARYAALCQEADIVPIVEPEVLMTHDKDIQTSYEATLKAQKALFKELKEQRVDLTGVVLKPNFVISGFDCPERAGVNEVIDMTYKCLKETVPEEVPGIAFLSGGISDELATEYLKVLNQKYKEEAPWSFTFSYGRGLQRQPLKIWANDMNDVEAAQKSLREKAEANGNASKGE